MKLAPVSIAALLVAVLAYVLYLADVSAFQDSVLLMGGAIVLSILGLKEQ